MTVLKSFTQLSEVIYCCDLAVAFRSFLKLIVKGPSVSTTQVLHHNVYTIAILVIDEFVHLDDVWMIEPQHRCNEWIIYCERLSDVALLECFECIVLLILGVDAFKD